MVSRFHIHRFGLLRLTLCLGLLWPCAQPLFAQSIGELTIERASWGCHSNWINVTEPVQELLKDKNKSFRIENSAFGKGDPKSGWKKRLAVTYRYRGMQKKIVRDEWQKLSYNIILSHAIGQPVKNLDKRPGEVDEQILTHEQMVGVVLIEGDEGVATGFIARVNDMDCVVTNLHVLGNNKKIVLRTLDGKRVQVDVAGIYGAFEADIALLKLGENETPPTPLTLAENVLETAKIGNRVVIVGNRLGGGVATQTVGSVRGVGPTRIEVNADFQSGNSGSPIYDIKSNQVVGVAAYTQTTRVGSLLSDSFTSSTLNMENRWFGYRLDTVEKWDKIKWADWRKQTNMINAYREESMAVLSLLQGDMSSAKEDPNLKRVLESNGVKSKPKDRATMKRVLSAARSMATKSSKRLERGTFYNYYKTCLYWETNVEKQTDFRKRLIEALDEIIGDL